MNFKIFDKSLDNIDYNQKQVINTINPHSYCTTKRDKPFKDVLQNSDILLPDGIGIVWALKLLSGNKIKKIAGYDLFEHAMKHLNNTSGTCFFLGSTVETLSLIEARLQKDYPNVTVGSYSPPYKSEFNDIDTNKMISEVNKVSPDILFVGMTAPKQEKWSFANKEQLKATTITSIGAVFDFYAGTVKRSNPFWIKLGLEWLPRFLKEPKRLAERNLVSTPKFIFEIISFKLSNILKGNFIKHTHTNNRNFT